MTPRASGRKSVKQYDAEYFDRWYRRSSIGVGRRQFVERKVRLALSAAEYVLGRKANSVLDVGCGEGPWRAILRKLRPGISYLGIDSSEYAIARYGRTRRLRLGGLSDLAHMRLARTYDLVVCSDVLHYVSDDEARAGLAAIAPRVEGAAFLEAFSNTDEIDGDHAELQDRSAAAYHRLFAEAGLEPVGLHVYVRRDTFEQRKGRGGRVRGGICARFYDEAARTSDRATFLAFKKRVQLIPLVERDRILLNIYSVLEPNAGKFPRVNVVGGKAFADFMVSKEVQEVIRTFGVDKFGEPLFFPDAGKREEAL